MSEVLGGLKVNNLIWLSTSLTLGALFVCVLVYFIESGTAVIRVILQLWIPQWNTLIQSFLELE
jgi:hypothetical protein